MSLFTFLTVEIRGRSSHFLIRHHFQKVNELLMCSALRHHTLPHSFTSLSR